MLLMTPDSNPSSHPLSVPELKNGHLIAAANGAHGPFASESEGALGPPGLSSAPTLTALLQALRRRWLLALGLALTAAVTAVIGVFLYMPPHFVVESRVVLNSAPDQGLFDAGPGGHVEFAVFKEYQKALVRSPLILAAALNEKVTSGREARDLPAIRAHGNDALEWIDRSLKVDFKVAPEVMSIWLSGDDPEGLADLLNAIVAAFINENTEKEKSRRRERLELYRENLKTKEQELSTLRGKLAAKQRPGEVKERLDKERQLTQLQQDLAAAKILLQNLQARRGETDLELAELRARQTVLSTQSAPVEMLEEYLHSDPKTQAIVRQIDEIDAKLLDYPRKFQGKTLQELIGPEEANRKTLEAKLDRRRDEIEPQVTARYRAKLKAELAEKIDVAQKRKGFVDSQIKALRDEAEALNQKIAGLDPSILMDPPDVLHLKDEVKSTEAAVDNVRQMVLKLSVEGASSRVSLQLRASPPTERDYSRQIKMAGGGGFLAFMLVLLGIALWEFRARRICMTDEVSRGLGLNVVGALPAVPPQARRAAAAPAANDFGLGSQLQESIDGVRTMLLHAARTEPLRIIMVTSACGGEGKTSVATQLAASLARAWRKTLLVDGDLRNPAAQHIFEVPREPGLSEILRGEVTVEDAIRPAPVSRLWVLPAGQWDQSALEALAQDNVATLFEQLRSQYDFVVVDSCPVLPVADALLLGQHVDGVLFSILRDVSRAPEVYAAHQRLAALGARTLGAVVIGMSSDLSSRAYQYAAGA
jgi:capsular exopolysaccharide synthesis family protein